MYLSRLDLSISSPAVRQALRNCQDMHKTLMKGFDVAREEAGMLYRVVRTEAAISIYVQSLARPQWERIEKSRFQCARMQDISAILEKLRQDTVLRFSLLACPSKKVKGDGKNSQRVLLRGAEERLEWLKREGEKHGFALLEAHEAAKEQKLSGRKASGEFFLAGVPFEGVLRITDEAAFRDAFRRGIGPEKAYGFGMLMLGREQP
ncbi:MAG: type I-E CRISPR-associated protein Cas6/Cse3/CasE [Clostridia bacterium]|nr:type I-E CRISPR-associated protein Cas6/Cse3/CasE [Clostridia bacterium]